MDIIKVTQELFNQEIFNQEIFNQEIFNQEIFNQELLLQYKDLILYNVYESDRLLRPFFHQDLLTLLDFPK
jgi:hypothetical protein